MTNNSKGTTLLYYRINYSHKSFMIQAPGLKFNHLAFLENIGLG
jgi:hypothetical protein